MLNALHTSSSLIHTTVLWGRYYFDHFEKRKDSSEKLRNIPLTSLSKLGSSGSKADATHHLFNYQISIEPLWVPGTDLDAGEEQWAQQRPCPHGAYIRKSTSEPRFLSPLCQLCPLNSTKKETCRAVEMNRNHLLGMPRDLTPAFPMSSQETFI